MYVKKINALVAIKNPSIERHIDYCDWVWTWFESTNMSPDWMFLQFSWNFPWVQKMISKNRGLYTSDVIKMIANWHATIPWEHIWRLVISKFDLSKWKAWRFIDESKSLFDKWFVITRFFFEKEWQYIDFSQAYLVFEKTI